MTKKRTKAHKAHINHKAHKTNEASEKKEEHVSDKVSTSPMAGNIALIAVVFLVVGLLVGALISYGAFIMNAPVDSVITDGDGVNFAASPVDTEALKLKVEEFLNNNNEELGIPEAAKIQITDVFAVGDGIFNFDVGLEIEGEVVPAGAVMATENKIILGPVLDLNFSSEKTNDGTVTVAKQEVPDVDLYIWGYCPGGAATLDIYAEAVAELAEVANVGVVLFHAGHGEFELQQNKIQAAIQELFPEKYWDYAKDVYDDVYPVCNTSNGTAANAGTVECDLEESTKLMEKVGIDADAVMALVEQKGDILFATDREKSIALGISTSPSLVINGINVGPFEKTPEGIKNSICSTFTEIPEVCGVQLSEEQTTDSGYC